MKQTVAKLVFDPSQLLAKVEDNIKCMTKVESSNALAAATMSEMDIYRHHQPSQVHDDQGGILQHSRCPRRS